METDEPDADRLTRRSLFSRGAGAGGALALGGAGSALAAEEGLRVWRLEPDWNNQDYCKVNERNRPRSCHGCRACHRHARNKLFRSKGAADRGRAHEGCRCRVKSAGRLPRRTWVKLFGNPNNPRNGSVDRRDPEIQEILDG